MVQLLQVPEIGILSSVESPIFNGSCDVCVSTSDAAPCNVKQMRPRQFRGLLLLVHNCMLHHCLEAFYCGQAREGLGTVSVAFASHCKAPHLTSTRRHRTIR